MRFWVIGAQKTLWVEVEQEEGGKYRDPMWLKAYLKVAKGKEDVHLSYSIILNTSKDYR